jgi:hypothetical protein
VRQNGTDENNVFLVFDNTHDPEVISANIEYHKVVMVVSVSKRGFYIREITPIGGLNRFDPCPHRRFGVGVF